MILIKIKKYISFNERGDIYMGGKKGKRKKKETKLHSTCIYLNLKFPKLKSKTNLYALYPCVINLYKVLSR